MVDRINNAGCIAPQADKTVKKHEQAAQKDSASIFNNKKIEGLASNDATDYFDYHADMTQLNAVIEGRTNQTEKLDFNHIGQKTLEGGLRQALDNN